jgi:hypothetical protein
LAMRSPLGTLEASMRRVPRKRSVEAANWTEVPNAAAAFFGGAPPRPGAEPAPVTRALRARTAWAVRGQDPPAALPESPLRATTSRPPAVDLLPGARRMALAIERDVERPATAIALRAPSSWMSFLQPRCTFGVDTVGHPIGDACAHRDGLETPVGPPCTTTSSG